MWRKSTFKLVVSVKYNNFLAKRELDVIDTFLLCNCYGSKASALWKIFSIQADILSGAKISCFFDRHLYKEISLYKCILVKE